MNSRVLTRFADKMRQQSGIIRIMFMGIALGSLLLAAGCDRNVVYEKNTTIEDGAWKAGDIAKFNVPVEDSTSVYNFYLNIRVTNAYKYANMFLFMRTLYPGGQISVDTVECFLADVDGRWLGTRSGRHIDSRVLMLRNFKYPESGTYSFEFEQAMRDSILEHVADFGIRIEKATP